MVATKKKYVFVDTGAWIALATCSDTHNQRAKHIWGHLLSTGARLRTSVPVVIETFTFLERNASRDIAMLWKDALQQIPHFKILEVALTDLQASWRYFERRDIHKLSATDACSFAVMKREKIKCAFAFDHHFSTVGFQLV